MKSIQFGKSKINYNIKRSIRRKTTEIVVSKMGVNVLTTIQKPENEINGLVQSHSGWIFKKKLSIKEEKPMKISYENNSKLPYLGMNYPLLIKETKQKESFEFSNKKFVAKIPNPTKYKIRKLYSSWIENEAKSQLPKHVQKFTKKLGYTGNKIRSDSLHGKWGLVSKSGKITMNSCLIRAPKNIIDYVAAHESCHLKIPNHSDDFWNLLESIMPDYEERKEWLKINKRLLTN